MPYAPRILIVEDEPRVQELFERILSEDGYSVRAVATGRYALRLLTQHEFELVLVDMSLPDFDGPDLLRTIAAEFPHIKVLAMSGAMEGPMGDLARLAGALAYYAKPLSPKELREAVYAALDFSGRWRGQAAD